MNNQRLVFATLVGSAAQIAMAVSGHVVPAIKELFMVGGLGISLIAGLVYAARAASSWGSSALGGAIAGGLCALIGIALSVGLHDVPASLLALGTVGSAVTGLLGGLIGRATRSATSAASGP